MSDPTVKSLEIFFTNLLKNTSNCYELDLKKEELLRMKLGLNIDKVCIKPSKIHGNGLYAKVNIKKGDIITLYPCDVLVYYPETNKEIDHPVGYIFSDELKELPEMQAIFNNNRQLYKGYQLTVNETYSIIGMPEICDNTTYMGHICNDGARGHTKEDKKIYETVSFLKSNAHFKNICDCMMAIVAMKDIQKDNEILVTYGHGYWLTH